MSKAMKKTLRIVGVMLLSACCVLCVFAGADKLFSIPQGWNIPEYDFAKNPLTSEKVELGRALFYDPILSRNNTISCASCHSQKYAFSDSPNKFSRGIQQKMQKRNTLALFNLAWYPKLFWDGRVNSIEEFLCVTSASSAPLR